MSNMLYLGDSKEVLNKLEKESIDMVITSPPYDNLRSYNECKWNFEVFKEIANGLYKVLKKGGVIVWIVNDATIKGSETGTSFKQVLYFKEIGLNLHDTMIWEKNCSPYPSGSHSVRYTNMFEFMFILSKGRPKTINLIMDKVNKYAGDKGWGSISKYKREAKKVSQKRATKKIGVRTNIWRIPVANIIKDKFCSKHSAIYPEKLVEDHINTWSDEGDIILDCFAGSGTSLKVASLLKRNFIGIELNKEYIEITKKRLDKYNIKYNAIIQ